MPARGFELKGERVPQLRTETLDAALPANARSTRSCRTLDDLDLAGYHLFHAARGDLLGRLGRHGDASEADALAANLAASQAERTFLSFRLATAKTAG
jgi:predicted RNA polymerase sigma factor